MDEAIAAIYLANGQRRGTFTILMIVADSLTLSVERKGSG